MRTVVRAALAGALLLTMALPATVDAKGKGADKGSNERVERSRDDDRDRRALEEARKREERRAGEEKKRAEEAKRARDGDDRAQREVAPSGRQRPPAPV